MKDQGPVFCRSLILLAGIVGAVPVADAAGDDFPPELVAWQRDPATPVFAGTGGPTWDRQIRERGWILAHEGRLHLFYTGYNEALSPSRLLGHATSTDGVHWQRDPANPLVATGWVEDVTVLRNGDTYRMFAEGERDIAHELVSRDLLHWKELGPLDIRRVDGTPIAPGPRGTPFVLSEGGVWNLLYERGDQGVWLARSPDGKVWTNVQDDPVLTMGPEPYDRTAVAINQVVKRDGVYYAYYHANASKPWRDWTTCIARSHDLVHWEKYAGNPILRENRSSAILVEEPDGRSHLYTMHPEIVRYSNPDPAAQP